MSSGYVLNFSDRTFREFIWEHVGRDINDGAYSEYGTSKAKRLRAFWEVEPDNVIATLLAAGLGRSGDIRILNRSEACSK